MSLLYLFSDNMHGRTMFQMHATEQNLNIQHLAYASITIYKVMHDVIFLKCLILMHARNVVFCA